MIDKIIIGICALGTVAAVFLFVRNMQQNPMERRDAALRMRLAAITPENIEYTTNSDVDYVDIMARIAEKPNLWEELVPPPPAPPPPPKPEVPPDWGQILQGVEISYQQQIGLGENAKPFIKTPHNGRGAFMGLGDNIKGAVITRVTRDGVMFSIVKDGKEYSFELPRK